VSVKCEVKAKLIAILKSLITHTHTHTRTYVYILFIYIYMYIAVCY